MESHVDELIRQVAKKRGFDTFTRDTKVYIKETVFRCNQTKVQLKNGNRVLHLLVKTPPEDKEIRAIQKTGAKFSNEILSFKEVYPKLKKYGWNGRVPFFYGSTMEKGKEAIVIEDLEAEGLKMVNIPLGLDTDHYRLVSESLTILHRASWDWKTKEEEDFKRTTKLIQDATILDVPDESELTMQKIIVDKALEAGQIHASYHFDKELDGKMAEVRKSIFGDMRSWKSCDNPNQLLLHGDPWIQAFLFKYEGKKPKEVVLVDWQKIAIGSAAMDVSLSILGSAGLQILSNPENLLNSYKSVHKVDVFKKEFKSVGKFGLTMALINILFASVEEDIPLEQIMKGLLRSPQLRDEGFKRLTMRIGGIVKASADLGLI